MSVYCGLLPSCYFACMQSQRKWDDYMLIDTASLRGKGAGTLHTAFILRPLSGYETSYLLHIFDRRFAEAAALQAQADFYTKRWLSVQQRFWGRSQWVLGIDSDIMAVNLSRSLDAFLEMPQDLVLTVRV